MDESSERGPMWLCRSREHQWPLREHAEMCCHTHQLEVHYGHGPTTYSGPEPVLPFNGTDEPAEVAYCWILVEPDKATKPLELQLMYGDPSELHPYERDRLGAWRPGIYADREVVSTETYERAIVVARLSLRRAPKPPEVEPFIAKATAQRDHTSIR
jgi:hypothetical protein